LSKDRSEIDLAPELGLPPIVVNLNKKAVVDVERCPAKMREACAVHIPFKLAAIRYALDRWPSEFRTLSKDEKAKGSRSYPQHLTSEWLAAKE
jgi:hypothetical protein